MPDLVGLSTVTANTPLTLTKTNEAGIGEVLQKWRVDDDTASFTQIMNASTTNAVFAPWLYSQNASTSFSGLLISALIGTAADTGTIPAMVIDNKKVNFTAIATRPLFDLRNSGVSALKVNADYTVLIKSLLKFDTTGLTAERTFTFPDSSGQTTINQATQTLAAKTLTTPIINGVKYTDAVKTGNYTLTTADTIIRADASAAAFTLTLPAASTNDGLTYTIIRTDLLASSNILTIDGNAVETIGGTTTYLLSPGESVIIESDGANWQVIKGNHPSDIGYYFLKGNTADRRYIAGIANNDTLITSTTAPTVNTLYAMPFFVAKPTNFNFVECEVTTLGSGSNVRVGIYNDTGNVYPGTLRFDSGSISSATAGIKGTAISASVQAFAAGLYWLVFECSATAPQIRALPGAGSMIGILGWGGAGFGANPPAVCYTVAHTLGALPNPYTAGAALRNAVSTVSSPIPAVGMRSS